MEEAFFTFLMYVFNCTSIVVGFGFHFIFVVFFGIVVGASDLLPQWKASLRSSLNLSICLCRSVISCVSFVSGTGKNLTPSPKTICSTGDIL